MNSNLRKVILYIAISLDGYIADTNGGIDWLNDLEITEEDTSYEDLYKDIDTVVLGRTTYDQIVNQLAINNYPYEDKLSYIITNRLLENSHNKIFTNENVVDLIEDLRKKEGQDIWIVGGNSIINPLIKNNLIDEYQLTIMPLILGSGIPLFKDDNSRLKLNFKSMDVKNKMVFLKYNKTC